MENLNLLFDKHTHLFTQQTLFDKCMHILAGKIKILFSKLAGHNQTI